MSSSSNGNIDMPAINRLELDRRVHRYLNREVHVLAATFGVDRDYVRSSSTLKACPPASMRLHTRRGGRIAPAAKRAVSTLWLHHDLRGHSSVTVMLPESGEP